MLSMLCKKGAVAVVFAFSYACSSAGAFSEADVRGGGTFSLSHSKEAVRATASISVRAPKDKDPAKSIGNFNALLKLNLALNDAQLSIPKECNPKLLDINYIKLEDVGTLFQFWVQGGDGSEAYQVVFTFGLAQPVKCRFLPDENSVSIEPMLSQRAYDALSKGKSIKK